MADGTIFDQTQETALTAAHRLLVQDTSAATASQSATFALMGGLEHNAQTVTTADITGAVGQLYYCTIAGLTADRNLTLPASAQVGERIGVYIVDGDDTYELIVKGAATVTINGGSAATEWSRLFIANECVIFRCVSSTAWIVEYDGRIPCKAHAYLTADETSIAATTWTKVSLSAEHHDVGDCFDAVTNYRFNARRAGYYTIRWQWRSTGGITNSFGSAGIWISGTQMSEASDALDDFSYFCQPITIKTRELAVDDYVEFYVRVSSTSVDIDAWHVGTAAHVEEIL